MTTLRRICLLFFAAVLCAQEPTEKEAPAPAPPPPKEAAAPAAEPLRHEVTLRSGTILVGGLEPTVLKVRTHFGDLTIPVRDVKQIRFGRKADPERYRAVLDAIRDLASGSTDRRRHAAAKLREEAKFAAPELRETAKQHADPEVRRVCAEILETLPDDDDEDPLPAEDHVRTTLFTVSGTVVQSAFKITVREFGAIDVRRRDIVSIGLKSARLEQRFEMDGKYTVAGEWLDTGLQLEEGLAYKIVASGSLTFPNWGGQVFSPEGAFNRGNVNGFPFGVLAGRIGDAGTPFRIGRYYEDAPAGKGTLQLCIMINMRGQPTTGAYKVRVVVE